MACPILPDGSRLKVDWSSWEPLEIFYMIQQIGQVPEKEMRRVFNLGIGFIFVIDKNFVDAAIEVLNSIHQEPIIIGEII